MKTPSSTTGTETHREQARLDDTFVGKEFFSLIHRQIESKQVRLDGAFDDKGNFPRVQR